MSICMMSIDTYRDIMDNVEACIANAMTTVLTCQVISNI